MFYSGADLIRTSGQQQERLDRLQGASPPVNPVSSPQDSGSQLDSETQGALLRFARFLHKEGEKKKQPSEMSRPETTPTADNPYLAAQARREALSGRGQLLDVYV